MTTFRQLNDGWNAEPNAPEPKVAVDGRDVVVSFLMNPFRFPQLSAEDVGRLRFTSCQRYTGLAPPTTRDGFAASADSARLHHVGVSFTRPLVIYG